MVVGVVFTVIGIGFAVAVPALLMPDWHGVERPASVTRFDTNREAWFAPSFRSRARHAPTRLRPGRTGRHRSGARVTIVTNTGSEDWYVKAGRDMQVAVWILRPFVLDTVAELMAPAFR